MSGPLRQGSGRAYAEVIGDPIAHSKSPLIHNFWLERLGIDAEYRATRVVRSVLADYFAMRRKDSFWRGCNVTIPHKEASISCLNGLDGAASSVGAVNTVIPREAGRLAGYNTDVEALAHELEGTLNFLAAAEIGAAVIGTGGAARAILGVYRRYGLSHITIVARDAVKATSLLSEFGLNGSVQGLDQKLAVGGLLVNASPLGMTGQPALDLQFSGSPLVFDLVYAPVETPLLRAARSRGLATLDGFVLLIGQAALAFHRLFGVERPVGVEQELRALLTA